MSQYTMLGGYKIDVETEPYDKGSFDTDYSKAIQLTIRLSANNSHKEKMECYFIQANDYATFYDICDYPQLQQELHQINLLTQKKYLHLC